MFDSQNATFNVQIVNGFTVIVEDWQDTSNMNVV